MLCIRSKSIDNDLSSFDSLLAWTICSLSSLFSILHYLFLFHPFITLSSIARSLRSLRSPSPVSLSLTLCLLLVVCRRYLHHYLWFMVIPFDGVSMTILIPLCGFFYHSLGARNAELAFWSVKKISCFVVVAAPRSSDHALIEFVKRIMVASFRTLSRCYDRWKCVRNEETIARFTNCAWWALCVPLSFLPPFIALTFLTELVW